MQRNLAIRKKFNWEDVPENVIEKFAYQMVAKGDFLDFFRQFLGKQGKSNWSVDVLCEY